MKNKPLFLNDKWYISKGKSYFPNRTFISEIECIKECKIQDMIDAYEKFEQARDKLIKDYPDIEGSIDDLLC